MITTAATRYRLSAPLAGAALYTTDGGESIHARGRAFARAYDQATAAWHAAPEGSELAHQRGLARRAVLTQAFREGFRLY